MSCSYGSFWIFLSARLSGILKSIFRHADFNFRRELLYDARDIANVRRIALDLIDLKRNGVILQTWHQLFELLEKW